MFNVINDMKINYYSIVKRISFVMKNEISFDVRFMSIL